MGFLGGFSRTPGWLFNQSLGSVDPLRLGVVPVAVPGQSDSVLAGASSSATATAGKSAAASATATSIVSTSVA